MCAHRIRELSDDELQVAFQRCVSHPGDVPQISEDVMIAEVHRRLSSQYTDIPADQVSRAVQAAQARFAQSPIRDFVPLLVERHARNQLANAG